MSRAEEILKMSEKVALGPKKKLIVKNDIWVITKDNLANKRDD
jgi:hypothetical protein